MGAGKGEEGQAGWALLRVPDWSGSAGRGGLRKPDVRTVSSLLAVEAAAGKQHREEPGISGKRAVAAGRVTFRGQPHSLGPECPFLTELCCGLYLGM